MERKAPIRAQEPPPERRRFLRESLTGSVPLLLDWVAGQARQLARLAQEPRRISPPLAAKATPPPPAKEKLDAHYAEFADENPDADPYSPRSFPEGSREVK